MLEIIWFFLIGVLLIGYAILDGFDLGVGSLHLLSKGDRERRTMMKSIGPVWDGNEVWLVTAGGALFAAFPHAYATAFSGFYVPFMLLLFCLIFRAVALEVRSKETWGWWRTLWDWAFALSSIVASILFGAAVGNLVVGLPIGEDMEYQGGLLNLLMPYQLVVGIFVLITFTMHGAIYTYMKTTGELQQRAKGWFRKSFAAFVAAYIVTTGLTIYQHPGMIENFKMFPWAWVVVLLTVLAIANIPRAVHLNLPFRAFVSSACTLAGIIFVFGIGIYPNMILSSLNPEWNLTIYNAASSQKTLMIMLIIAIIGMPLVIAYTAAIYWVFRGAVDVDAEGY